MAEKKQRKPTSTDVAELAGVSQTSVSLVLSGSSRATFSEQTRARVFEAARQLGYQPPAHRTRKKNGNDRRLILVLTPTLANQYYSELIQTLEDYAGSQEFRVLVCNTFRKRELEKYYLEQFSDPGGHIWGARVSPSRTFVQSEHTPALFTGDIVIA